LSENQSNFWWLAAFEMDETISTYSQYAGSIEKERLTAVISGFKGKLDTIRHRAFDA
jgi:hypothetical protein